MFSNKYEFEFSVSVIPVVKTEKSYIDIIQRAMQRVIPYIEELTRVRYYPVTTYLVDKYTVNSQCENILNGDESLYDMQDVKEVLRFLSWVAISYHAKRIFTRTKNFNYKDYSHLTEDQLEILNYISEGMCYYLEKYFDNNEDIDIGKLYIEGVSKQVNLIDNFFDDFYEILEVFKRLIKKENLQEISIEYDEKKAFPRLEVWQKYLNARRFSQIKKLVDVEGKWSNKLNDIIKITEIALEMLKQIIESIQENVRGFSIIASEMHTYGVYLHKDTSNNEFKEILRFNGFPTCIEQPSNGKVLICIDKIIERVNEVCASNKTIDRNFIIENMITATLVHEHTHAANFEGVKYNHPQPLFISEKNKDDYKYDIVYEALAEWAEFNYFRDNNIVSDIIKSHMNNADIKHWPYAGAELIENRFNELGITDFQAIFNMSRINYKNAYEILK